VHQSIVKIHCLEGIEFAGEGAINAKEAEKNAAKQAMLNYAGEVAALVDQPKTKKRKAEGEVTAPNEALHENPKSELNKALMRILERCVVKDDLVFTHVQTPQGFQATLQLPGLPGRFGKLAWAGEVAKTKKDSEKTSAQQALNAINGNPEFATAIATPPVKKQKAEGGGGKKEPREKKESTGEYWGPKERERVTKTRVAGKVAEWKGHFGWVELKKPIEHEQATKNGGKVYLHTKDWQGAAPPEAGKDITMFVYVDGSGMGAEEAK